MRIITGLAKGAKLITLDSYDTRPTTEKTKEAIFSMIQFETEGRRVLDLFGGSGQLALEALSRGADKATIIDESRDAVNIIIENAKHTKLYDRCSISVSSAETYIKRFSGEKFHLIFMDPPYASTLMKDCLSLISERDILEEGGTIICESETEPKKKKNREKKDEDLLRASVLKDVFGGDEEIMNRYTLLKSTVYGRTRITLLTK